MADDFHPSPEAAFQRGQLLQKQHRLTDAIACYKQAISLDGLLPEEGAKTALRALTSFDPAIKADKIDLGKTYTNEFARRAKEKYKA